ncbi:MAG: c-type cytochrome biogenesis protein CcmI [Rhodocyclales bacterium]|nr:c-type cytochrome biogenesis protein CcmI [Rhodocyclales bacterium]
MTAFVILAVVLTLAVLALLLYPLLLKERKQHVGSASELSITVLREQLGELDEQRKSGLLDARLFDEEQAELERRAIEDGTSGGSAALAVVPARKPTLAALVGVGLPALAVGLYLWLGSPDTMKPQQATDAAGNHALTPQQIQGMADKLAERLQSNPDDGEGWLMLARSYSVLGRYPESAAAFGRATGLLPPNAGLLADYADVVAMAQGRRLAGEPEKIIARALSIDPRHIKSLALSGTAAFERADYAAAIRDWRTILTLVPPDSQAAQSISNSIADAERRIGGVPGVLAAAPVAVPKVAGGPATVAGTVTLSPEFAGKVPGDATLFVFARNTDGSRIPLAMARVNGAKLPYAFKLDDSMSMAPNVKLSSAKSVIVGARISRSGDALAKPGDFEGYSVPVALGVGNVAVNIGSIVK